MRSGVLGVQWQQMNAGTRFSTGSPELDPDAQRKIEAELDQILSSDAFRNALRSQEFLRYIVEHTLAHEPQYLREREIQANVFHRAPDFGSGGDSLVRAKASELRKRLTQYYIESAQPHEVEIDLPPEGYVPEFHFAGELQRRSSTWRRTVPALLAIAALIVAGLVWRQTRMETAFDRFWNPVLDSNQPVVLCFASGSSVPAGSAVAGAEISGFLNRLGLEVRIGSGNMSSGNTPSILIGGSLPRAPVRFAVDEDQSVIRDLRKPGRIWANGDYLIVSRVFERGRVVITAEGVGPNGTQYAGAFLTNPVYLDRAVKNLPSDWPKRNMQLLMEGRSDGPGVIGHWLW